MPDLFPDGRTEGAFEWHTDLEKEVDVLTEAVIDDAWRALECAIENGALSVTAGIRLNRENVSCIFQVHLNAYCVGTIDIKPKISDNLGFNDQEKATIESQIASSMKTYHGVIEIREMLHCIASANREIGHIQHKVEAAKKLQPAELVLQPTLL